MNRPWIDAYLAESVIALQDFAIAGPVLDTLADMADRLCVCFRNGGKLLVAGNGGSASDSQHIACELVGRLMFDRGPLAALALTADSSTLTALSNDYGYDKMFERQVRAFGRPGDVLLGISTSGRSANILAAMDSARKAGLVSMVFCGRDPAGLAGCDYVLATPSARTPVIQQLHVTAAHMLCGLIERQMFPDGVTQR